MESAENINDEVLLVTFTGDAEAIDFVFTDFSTAPNGYNPNNIFDVASNILNLSFLEDLSTETTLNYSGAVPGFLSPDSIAIT